jgi:membrane protease YdiL (CAAX protease family)
MGPEPSPAAAVAPPEAPSRILSANLLFLITLGLILIAGSAMQALRPRPGLIGTELFCILLPAWWFAKRTGDTAGALRLQWPGIGPCCLGLMTGAGTLALALALDAGATRILGYEFRVPDGFLPHGLTDTLTYGVAMAIAAPFCEEMVFRGYILGAYERAGLPPRTAVLAVAGLFTAWHLSPARAPGVAVAAFTITYLAWRTGSVWPSVAGHIGANGTAALLYLVRNHVSAPILATIGIPATAFAAGCLWYAGRRYMPAPVIVPAENRAGVWWPLWVAGAVVLAVGGAEVTMHHWHRDSQPESMVRVSAPWTAPVRLQYEIHGKSGLAGTAEYRITPAADTIDLEATLDFRKPNELTGEAAKVRIEGTWDRQSLVLRRFSGHVDGPGRADRFDYYENDAPLPAPGFSRWFYSPAELPWRLSAATTLEERNGRPVTVKLHEAPLTGRAADAARDIHVQAETLEEPVQTRAGQFRTVRIAIGPDASAWYDVDRPHTLVQYRTPTTLWMLTRQ